MKHLCKSLLIFLLPLIAAHAQTNQKITDMPAASSLLSTDIFPLVYDPGVTKVNKKSTFSTLMAFSAAYAQPLTNKTISLTSNTLTMTSAQLATALSDETGSGSAVFSISPTLVTPTLGVATATSINGLTIVTTSGSLSIANSTTFTSSKTMTLTAGTNGISVNLVNGGTLSAAAYTSGQDTGWGQDTGTADKTTHATYAGQTVSDPPEAAEVQAIDDLVKRLTEQVKALKDLLHSNTLSD